MPDIKGDSLTNEVYARFIEEAVKRSDAFSIQIFIPSPTSEESHNTFIKQFDTFDPIQFYNISGKTIDECKIMWQNMFEQQHRDAAIFPEVCIPFLNELETYRIKCTNKNLLYRVCDNTKNLLLKPNAILDWKYPNYPEDIAFYKNRYCWFFTTTHESSVTLLVDNEEEIRFWNDMGIIFTNGFEYKKEIENRLFCKYDL